MESIYIDLGSVLDSKILASSLIAYTPVFGEITLIDMDYARLLFLCAGVVDDDRNETYHNTGYWIDTYQDVAFTNGNNSRPLGLI